MADEKFDKMDEMDDDRNLGKLLREMKRFDAPNDFDFRVKARIADADPSKFNRRTGWLIPVYIVSLAVLVIVGSFFVLREFYPANTGPVPEVVETKPTTLTKPIENREIRSVNDKDLAAADTGNKAEVAAPVNADKGKRVTDTQQPGGSRDSSLNGTQQILPRGFDVNASRKNASPPMNNAQIPITGLMNSLGIAARFEGQALIAVSVREGSVADRSGVKAGDIIESVDDKAITPSAKFGSRIDAKTLTILRDGQPMQLNIRVQ